MLVHLNFGKLKFWNTFKDQKLAYTNTIAHNSIHKQRDTKNIFQTRAKKKEMKQDFLLWSWLLSLVFLIMYNNPGDSHKRIGRYHIKQLEDLFMLLIQATQNLFQNFLQKSPHHHPHKHHHHYEDQEIYLPSLIYLYDYLSLFYIISAFFQKNLWVIVLIKFENRNNYYRLPTNTLRTLFGHLIIMKTCIDSAP